jgi:hypothetical protein
MMGPDVAKLDSVFKLLDKSFNVSDEGSISGYLGIKISRLADGMRLKFTQLQLIDSILVDCGLDKANASLVKCQRFHCAFCYVMNMERHGTMKNGSTVQLSVSSTSLKNRPVS